MNKKILIVLVLLLSGQSFAESDIAEPNIDAWLYLSFNAGIIGRSLVIPDLKYKEVVEVGYIGAFALGLKNQYADHNYRIEFESMGFYPRLPDLPPTPFKIKNIDLKTSGIYSKDDIYIGSGVRMINIYYDWQDNDDPDNLLYPYVGAGVGIITTVYDTEKIGSSFAGQVKVGLNYRTKKNIAFNMGLRYLMFTNNTLEGELQDTKNNKSYKIVLPNKLGMEFGITLYFKKWK